MRPDTGFFFLFPSCLAIDSHLCVIRPLVSFLSVYLPPSWQEIKCRVPQVPNKTQTHARQNRTLILACRCVAAPKVRRNLQKRLSDLKESKSSCIWVKMEHWECAQTFRLYLENRLKLGFFFTLVFKEMGVYLKRESVYLMYHTPPKRFTYCSVICYFKSLQPHFLGG